MDRTFNPQSHGDSSHLPSANPLLLLNSSVPPDLTVGGAYSTPLCFQDPSAKELLDSLPDLQVKVQGSFTVSLAVAEHCGGHALPHFCASADGHWGELLTLGGRQRRLRICSIFGHRGGRLVAPYAGQQ